MCILTNCSDSLFEFSQDAFPANLFLLLIFRDMQKLSPVPIALPNKSGCGIFTDIRCSLSDQIHAYAITDSKLFLIDVEKLTVEKWLDGGTITTLILTGNKVIIGTNERYDLAIFF